MTMGELFDLVAPIAISGATDCSYLGRAEECWKKIQEVDPKEWEKYGCTPPPIKIPSLKDTEDFLFVYDVWALLTYDKLFEAIVEEYGPPGLCRGVDYWGAKGYRFPNQSSRNFEFSGDSCGMYPWYDSSDALIRRLRAFGG